MLAPTQRIAEGKGTANDLKEIEKKYRKSHESVVEVTRKMDHARHRLMGIDGGFEMIQRLQDITYGEKWLIRRHLADLVELREFDTQIAQESARAILIEIDRFNDGLASLHRDFFSA